MVDVTVDAKSMAKAPYDPADIPDSVKQRAKAIESFYGSDGKLNGSGELPSSPQQPPGSTEPAVSASQPAAAPVPQVPSIPEPSPSAPVPAPQAPAVSAPAPLEDENSETWKSRFLAMQGRHDSSQRIIAEMQDQMTQMGDALLKLQQQPRRQQQAPRRQQAPAPTYLTEQDVQNYGSDLVDFAQRAAAHAVAPQLTEVKTENAELRRQLAAEARRRLDQQVELNVPNYREIDREPRWHRWLLGIDAFTGRVRQTLLNDAIAAAEAPRVISFFRGFLAEEAATGHVTSAPQPDAKPPREPVIPLASLAAPGRPRPATGGDTSLPLDKPSYTRANIKQNYELHRRGAFAGREAEWNRLEHDMIAAGREGRVRS